MAKRSKERIHQQFSTQVSSDKKVAIINYRESEAEAHTSLMRIKVDRRQRPRGFRLLPTDMDLGHRRQRRLHCRRRSMINELAVSSFAFGKLFSQLFPLSGQRGGQFRIRPLQHSICI